MGLDMYLEAERGIWSSEPERPVVHGHTLKSYRVEAGYWRNANAIHEWFIREVVEDMDNCKDVTVPREKLEELLALCKRLVATRKRAKRKADKLAAESLPPTRGFFFGHYEVDGRYWEDVERTMTILADALERFAGKENGLDKYNFYYRASW